jgi:D-alanyl-lipoteichoic acid acyltransferase DltB (MBOAT superfamily)
MVFNSLSFLVFFGIVLLVYVMPLPWRVRKLHLLLASYAFYSAWNPPFVILLWISTVVDWSVAKRIPRAHGVFHRRALLVLSLATNLGLLGFFKYGGFLLDNFIRLLSALGIHYQPPDASIFLPIGISFYTFQTLSYTIDVYRGKFRPWPWLLDFALFVTFFPQLVAGPIVRASMFLPQCQISKWPTGAQLGWGFSLLLLGLFEKTVLADALMAPVADVVYATPSSAGFVDAWVGTLAFSAQIFFDFAGYSTCAIGAALCLGFYLPNNFRFPYGAIGFSDFWRRWHISLSTWLRDYLYISLGGNRRGSRRTHVNLMLTMLLGGLWHGAAWRFVVWGGLHGSYLWVERWIKGRFAGRPWSESLAVKLFLLFLTYYLVCITWVFFRARDFSGAFILTKTMLFGGPNLMSVGTFNVALVGATTVALLAGHWLMRHRSLEGVAARVPWWGRALTLAILLIALILSPSNNRAFIYFQF